MDGRGEGMPSFYRKGGSSSQSGGPHIPTPGFKTEPNTHGHTTMRLSSSFQLEHIHLPGGISRGGGSSGSGSGGDVVKKKRGRPRKYVPDESGMELALAPVAGSGSGSVSPGPKKNRGRPPGSGWKQRLANVGDWMNSSAGLAFTPHIIHVSVGEDVAEKILSFAKQRPRALCILSGNGTVSAVTLSQFTSSGGTVTYEGRFEILCLSGSYLLSENGGPHNRTGGLSISICCGDGKVIGGAIGGKLVASSTVQVMVCSFVYGGNNVKTTTKMEAPSTDEKRLDIELNEATPIAVPWQTDSQAGLRNSPTEIDLSRG